MGWPVHYLHLGRTGTVYIERNKIDTYIKEHGYTGQGWRYKGKWSSYMPSKDLILKDILRLSPKDTEDFYHITGSCKRAGLKPPLSFSDIFGQIFRSPMLKPSVSNIFQNTQFGGWEAVIKRGTHSGKVWHYDLNKAYRWAAECGLPDIRTAKPIKDFITGLSIYTIVNHPRLEKTIPYWRQYDKTAIVTSEEIARFNLCGLQFINGISFSGLIDFKPVFDFIVKNFPYCFSRIGHAFWGRWNTPSGAEQVSWGTGQEKSRVMMNPVYNPIWTAFVTSRVKMRLMDYYQHTLHVFVDSILSTEELAVSDAVGAFKLVGEYPKGVWVRGAGHWGTGNYIVKHAGQTETGRKLMLTVPGSSVILDTSFV